MEIDGGAGEGAVLAAAKAASGMRTVPQVFIAGECVGGADDLQAGIEAGTVQAMAAATTWGITQQLPAALADAAIHALATADVAGTIPAGSDGGRPDGSVGGSAVGALREVGGEVGGDRYTVDSVEWERLDALAARMATELVPRDAWTSGGWRAPLRREPACVTGAEIVGWLAGHSAGSGGGSHGLTRPAATALGQRLMDLGFLVSVTASEPVADAPGLLYRLADHAADPVPYPRTTPGALNARRRWRDSNPRPARDVAASLRRRILALYDAYLSEDGREVDYAGMRGSAEFAAYVEAAAELQTVDLHALTRQERTAFFINVYNAMIVHITAAVGPPGGFFDRLTFFGRYRYEIGGCEYSCDDIEHGILRGNRPGAASLEAILGVPGLSRGPFGPRDPRWGWRARSLSPPGAVTIPTSLARGTTRLDVSTLDAVC